MDKNGSSTALFRPMEIEKKSFGIIEEELKERGKQIAPEYRDILYRVIHTTADFDYADTLFFSPDALRAAQEAFVPGTLIVTDTNMALSGIHRSSVERLEMECACYMAAPEVAEEARRRGCTRAVVSMEKAMAQKRKVILAVGNAPTALLRIEELFREGFRPALVIGVPVGFVNVVQSKKAIIETGLPCIVNRGRKGGSNVAAAIVNALLYQRDRARGER